MHVKHPFRKDMLQMLLYGHSTAVTGNFPSIQDKIPLMDKKETYIFPLVHLVYIVETTDTL